MSDQVFYQDGRVTITDKVIVTKKKVYELSSIAGLSSEIKISYIIFTVIVAALFVLSVNNDLKDGVDLRFTIAGPFIVLGAIYGIVSLFPTRKLMASLAAGGRVVLVGGISKSRAQAIMYAFTLAKNA
jgi:hypothetical protein